MKNKKSISMIVPVIFICLASCLVARQLYLEHCFWWYCAPFRSFDTSDLGLPLDLFPPDAQYGPIHFNRNLFPEALNNHSQTMHWENGRGLGVYRADQYAASASAKDDYLHSKTSFFQNAYTKIPWDEYVLTYNSNFADEFYSACGFRVPSDYRCAVVAHYQEFFVIFNTTITDEMTRADFKEIMVFIDQQMAGYLYGE